MGVAISTLVRTEPLAHGFGGDSPRRKPGLSACESASLGMLHKTVCRCDGPAYNFCHIWKRLGTPCRAPCP